MQSLEHDGFRRARLDLIGVGIEAGLVDDGVRRDALDENGRLRRARKPLAANGLDASPRQHVHHPVGRDSEIHADVDKQPLRILRAAVVHHWIGGGDVVGHHQPSAVVQRQEGRAPGDADDAAVDRLGHLVGVDRQPIAERIGAVEIDRQAREQVLDDGLQRDAEDDRGGADAVMRPVKEKPSSHHRPIERPAGQGRQSGCPGSAPAFRGLRRRCR